MPESTRRASTTGRRLLRRRDGSATEVECADRRSWSGDGGGSDAGRAVGQPQRGRTGRGSGARAASPLHEEDRPTSPQGCRCAGQTAARQGQRKCGSRTPPPAAQVGELKQERSAAQERRSAPERRSAGAQERRSAGIPRLLLLRLLLRFWASVLLSVLQKRAEGALRQTIPDHHWRRHRHDHDLTPFALFGMLEDELTRPDRGLQLLDRQRAGPLAVDEELRRPSALRR